MYYAKINWYCEWEDEDKISHVIVCAGDWNEAMQKINKEFSYMNSIEMEQIQSDKTNLVYITEEILNVIKDENNY